MEKEYSQYELMRLYEIYLRSCKLWHTSFEEDDDKSLYESGLCHIYASSHNNLLIRVTIKGFLFARKLPINIKLESTLRRGGCTDLKKAAKLLRALKLEQFPQFLAGHFGSPVSDLISYYYKRAERKNKKWS